MENKLHATRKQVEQIQVEFEKATLAQFYLEEIKAATLGEVSTLGETMTGLYEELITV